MLRRDSRRVTRRGRPATALVGGIAVVALSLSVVPRSLASHTVTAFSVTPASTQAGVAANASSSTSLSYSNPTDDAKKTIGHFAAGLVANPEAVPHCPQALYLADACPADTRIGESEADIQVFPGPPVTEKGRIYNQELLGSEAGRLGIIVDTAPAKTFLTAPFYVRTQSDFGLDGVLDDLPRIQPGVQVTRLSFTLYGTVGGRNFTRAPTSCTLKTSTGEAFAYDHPEPASGPSSSYTPTNCGALPFKPTFAISVGSRGTTRFNRNPPLRVKVTQQPGEAGVSGNSVTLPPELTPNVSAFGTICSSAQLAGNACPPGSQVGGAMATSPFLAGALAGPVWIVQQPGVVIPALVADLKGRVPIKVTIGTSFVGGRQIKSNVTGVPDLPIGSFSLALSGGTKGVLLTKSDLCARPSGSHRGMKAAVTFDAHSGATTSSSPRVEVEGCAPAARASLRGAARRAARLRLSIERHPDADKITRAELVLPKALRLVRSRVKRRGVTGTASARLGRRAFVVKSQRRLEIGGLPRGGSDRLALTLRRGAVRLSRRISRRARRGARTTLRLRLVSIDSAGQRSVTRVRARVTR